MSEPRCGAHCGDGGIGECFKCEVHGLCHMCVEEDWARRFDGIKKDNIELREFKNSCSKIFVDPQGAAQLLSQANEKLRKDLGFAKYDLQCKTKEVEQFARSACGGCYGAGTVLIAIDDADTCPACGGTGNEKAWELTQILKLIEAESGSSQSAFDSLLTCVNLAAKGLGKEYDEHINGANE